MKHNVMVFGATGKTGMEICRELKKVGINFSVFVRKESIAKMTIDDVPIFKGDMFNKKEVEEALNVESVTDIVIALGSKSLKNTGIRSRGTKHVVEVMKLHGIDAKLHVISALGVRESWSQLKWFEKAMAKLILKHVMADHMVQEELVVNSPFEYHIVRPVGLKDGISKGQVRNQTEGHLPKSYMTRAGVAKYLVESLMISKSGCSSICEV